MTATQTREQWLAARKTGLGGSDIAAVLGLSPWRSAVDVYIDKTSDAPDAFEQSEPMYWGNVLEAVVADEYAKRTEARVQRVNQQLRHPNYPWAIGNIDRAILEPGSRARFVNGRLLGAHGLLECKTASAYKLDDWIAADGSDATPVYYAAQGMWYLAISGLDWCDFAVLVGGQRFLTRRVERSNDAIFGMMEVAEEFWRKHVLERIPPEPRSAHDVVALFPRDDGDMIDASQRADVLARINDLRSVREAIAVRKQAEAELEEALKLDIGEHSGIVVDGKPAVTWKAARDGKKLDWGLAFAELARLYDDARAQQQPTSQDVLAKHTAPSAGSRRFLLKQESK